MKLTHCVNGFVDNEEDLPTYGQLGCKGFLVLDAQHRVVRDLAFEHVEALLDAVCSNKPLPKVCPGEYVTLVDPPKDKPEIKGSQGICVKVKDGLMQFGFLAGPLRGRTLELPFSAVSKLAPGSCSPSSCAAGDCSKGGCAEGSCSDGKCQPGGCPPGGCPPGGCPPNGACDAGTGLDEAFVAASLHLTSVKVPSMDAEHAECAAALQRLASQRTRQALEEVLSCLANHFQHEEALFVQYGFGVHVNENLSAQTSHAEDHGRILAKIRGELSGIAVSQGVLASFIRELLQDFHEHTSRYDALYAEPLSSKLAR